MPRGMQIAVSGLLAQQARLDLIANDIANVNTVGYKRARVAFQEIFGPPEAGASGGGVRALDGGRSSDQGTLQLSETPLSVALEGPGYIQTKLPDGTIGLSRGGDLRVDAERRLVLRSGERLEPLITIPPDTAVEDVSITEQGAVVVNGKKVGEITIVDVPAPTGLMNAAGGLLTPTAASGAPTPVKDTMVHQGYLEGSNVDVATAMVEMIEAQRAYALMSKTIQFQDQLMQLANEVRR